MMGKFRIDEEVQGEDADECDCSIRSGVIIKLKGMRSVWTPDTLVIHDGDTGEDKQFVHLPKSNYYVKWLCAMDPRSRAKRMALPVQNILDSMQLIRNAHIGKMLAVQVASHTDPLADIVQPCKKLKLKKSSKPSLPDWAYIELPCLGGQPKNKWQ